MRLYDSDAIAPYDRWVLNSKANTERVADFLAGITLAIPHLVLAKTSFERFIGSLIARYDDRFFYTYGQSVCV